MRSSFGAGRRMAVVLSLCVFPRAFAAGPCETTYAAFTEALTRARLPEDVNRRLFVKVSNAVRTFGSGTMPSSGKAAGQMNAAAAKLNGVAGVPDESRDAVRSAISALSACMATPPQRATVAVRVLIDGTPPRAAGAGVSVLVDNEEAGKTDAAGTISITAAVGTHIVSAQQIPDLQGHARGVEVAATSNPTVEVTMRAGADLAIPAELIVAEAADTVLSKNFKGVTLQLLDESGSAVRLRSIDLLAVVSEAGGTDVSRYFSVRGDGTVTLTNAHGFAAAVLKAPDPVTVRLRGRDASGSEYRAMTQVSLGRYTSTARLVPPPGVTVNTGSVYVCLTHEATNTSYWRRTSPAGLADFPQLPRGAYLVSCDVVQGKTRYFGRTGFVLDADGKRFDIPLFAVGAKQGKSSTPVVAAAASAPASSIVRLPETKTCYLDEQGNCHDTPPAPIQERVTTISFEIAANGEIRPRHVAQFDNYPHHLRSASEDDLLAVRQQDDEIRLRSGLGAVEIRAYDIHNDVVFRAVERVGLYRSKPVPSPTGQLLSNWAAVQPPWPFMVVLPRDGVLRVEVRGWLPHSETSFYVDALTHDAAMLALPQ